MKIRYDSLTKPSLKLPYLLELWRNNFTIIITIDLIFIFSTFMHFWSFPLRIHPSGMLPNLSSLLCLQYLFWIPKLKLSGYPILSYSQYIGSESWRHYYIHAWFHSTSTSRSSSCRWATIVEPTLSNKSTTQWENVWNILSPEHKICENNKPPSTVGKFMKCN